MIQIYNQPSKTLFNPSTIVTDIISFLRANVNASLLSSSTLLKAFTLRQASILTRSNSFLCRSTAAMKRSHSSPSSSSTSPRRFAEIQVIAPCNTAISLQRVCNFSRDTYRSSSQHLKLSLVPKRPSWPDRHVTLPRARIVVIPPRCGI